MRWTSTLSLSPYIIPYIIIPVRSSFTVVSERLRVFDTEMRADVRQLTPVIISGALNVQIHHLTLTMVILYDTAISLRQNYYLLLIFEGSYDTLEE